MRTSSVIALPLLTAAAGVSAQTVNTTFVTGLTQALNSAGFTSLAALGSSLGNSSTGASFLNAISQGKNTLLAPSNAAIAAANKTLLSNTALIQAILSYHWLSGQFNATSFANYPNHTVARTFLNDSSYVNLPGGQAQSLILSVVNGTDQVLGGQPNKTVVSLQASYDNIMIHQVDNVLSIPSTFNNTLTSLGLTTFSNALSRFLLLNKLTAARGVTVFAPNNFAFQEQSAVIPTLTTDAITTILTNHIVNGTVAYSTLLGQGTYTSAAGSSFSFFTNLTGSYVQSGTAVGRIINSDQLFNGGVIHVIDTVLFNQQNNTQAAQSAYSSYTQAAATAAVPTAAVVATAGAGTAAGSSSSSTTTSSSKNSAVSLSMHGMEWTTLIAGVFAGAALMI